MIHICAQNPPPRRCGSPASRTPSASIRKAASAAPNSGRLTEASVSSILTAMTVTVDTGSVDGEAGVTWSIDELAAIVGLPTRTIREYRTVGVLPPPRKVGRVGVYDVGHRRRLELIVRLQRRGYSLAGMRDLFDAWQRGASLDDVLAGGLDEAVVVLDEVELIERCPPLATRRWRERAEAVGMIRAAGDGRWFSRAPSQLDLVADAAAMGAEIGSILTAIGRWREGARRGAEALVAVLVDEPLGTADPAELARFARRARVLVAQAASAVFVDELGRLLDERSVDDPGLAALVDSVRIGTGRAVSGTTQG